ncbi:hypothetical protein [Sphingomonas cynarae]
MALMMIIPSPNTAIQAKPILKSVVIGTRRATSAVIGKISSSA